MKTYESIGQMTDKEWKQAVLDFNACHKAADKKQAIVRWLEKYTKNTQTPTGLGPMCTILELPKVIFSDIAINFYAIP